ncbi:MAG: universal stress protein [Candidatus Binatia bacterium]
MSNGQSWIHPRTEGVGELRISELVTHVAVCLDSSALSERTIPHAAAIASAFGARLSLLHVLDPREDGGPCTPDPLEWHMKRLQAIAYMEEVVERATTLHGGLQDEIRGEVLEGDPVLQISRWIEDHGVDLAVISTHGSSGVTMWSLASTTRKLLEGVRCSMLLVPAAAMEDPCTVERYERVLVPLDGSVWSESALPWAMQLAGAYGANIILAHAVPCPELTRAGAIPPTTEDLDLERRLIARNERVGRDYLDHLRARLSAAGLCVSTHVESSGRVSSELQLAIARAEPDLIVLPSCGGSGPGDGTQGLVVMHILAHASKPVLLVRSPSAGLDVHPCSDSRESAPRAPTQARL